MSVEPTAGGGAAQATPPIVLVVDDEPLIAQIMADLIDAAGFKPVVCGDGQEAIVRLEQLSDAVAGVVTDIRMPGASGWRVGARARELAPETAVVYVTGDSQPQWQVNGVAGSVLFEKPFTPSELVATLVQLIGGESAAVA